MKNPAANIPLTLFAASATGVAGTAFCVGPLLVLPYTIRAHGLRSFVPLMDIVVACAGLSVVVLSVAVGFRRRWAYQPLVRTMIGLTLVLALAIGRKTLQPGRTGTEHLLDLTAGPCLVALMGFVLLFLLNRRVQDELAR